METELPTNTAVREMVIEGLDNDQGQPVDPNIFKHNNEGMEEEAKQQ